MKKRAKGLAGILLAAAMLCAPLIAQAEQFLPEDAVESTTQNIQQEAQIPEVLVQDNFEEVKQQVEGGPDYMTKYGLSRAAVVGELEAHESDNYYLGTPYKGGDWQSPKGDTSYNGLAGMNCGGFVSYVLRKAGLDVQKAMQVIQLVPGNTNHYGSGKPYDILANADNFKNLVENGNLTAYAFQTKQEMLSSGQAEKGDIILMYWSKTPGLDSEDNHIGFFWGNSPSEDKMWHSNLEPNEGNQISVITPPAPSSYYILIKLEKPALEEPAPEKPAHHPVFRDVSLDAWYYAAVDYVYQEGVFSGSSETTFSPESAMTRGMFVTVLGKFAQVDPSGYAAGSFTDVTSRDYYAPYVEWAAESGLVSGVGGGKFAPGNSITREQMAIIFYKYAKTVGADTSVDADKLLSFPDWLSTSEYAQQAMAWAVTHGVLSGSDGKLVPQGTATRAQTAQIIYNAKDLLTTQVETPPADAVWVVDQFGHFITTEKLEQVLIPGTEVGHWEDVYESHTVYRCNTCGYIGETLDDIHAHLQASADQYWETGTRCSGYSLVASDPVPTGEKQWVVDKEGEYEWQQVTEHIWVEEAGHWE